MLEDRFARRLSAGRRRSDTQHNYGPENAGDELPSELARREERLRRIREAKRALEERARAEAAAEGKEEKEQKQVKPEAKAQYNFTDPESRIMKGADGFVQGYNAQLAVEPGLQLIVGQSVTQQANDKQQLLPMIKKVQEQSGQKPSAVLADSGYVSEENLRGVAKLGVEAYVAAGRQKHNQGVPPCPRGRIRKSATLLERMQRKLQTVTGRAIYARRKAIVEPVFGQIKQPAGIPAVSAAQYREGARGMGSGLHDAQPLEGVRSLL
jgi:Transposase DDE domain